MWALLSQLTRLGSFLLLMRFSPETRAPLTKGKEINQIWVTNPLWMNYHRIVRFLLIHLLAFLFSSKPRQSSWDSLIPFFHLSSSLHSKLSRNLNLILQGEESKRKPKARQRMRLNWWRVNSRRRRRRIFNQIIIKINSSLKEREAPNWTSSPLMRETERAGSQSRRNRHPLLPFLVSRLRPSPLSSCFAPFPDWTR